VYDIFGCLVEPQYMGKGWVWYACDIWANRGFGRQPVYDIFGCLVGRRYIIYSCVWWAGCI